MWELTTKEDTSLPASQPARWMYELWETDPDGVRYWITLSRGFLTEDDAIDDATRFGMNYHLEHRQVFDDPTHGRIWRNRDGGENDHRFDTAATRRELQGE